MKKKESILSIVYDDICADPRALKFKHALEENFNMYTLSLNTIDSKGESNDYRLIIGITNKYLKLIIFWIHIIKYVYKIKPNYILAHNYFVAFPCWIASSIFNKPLFYDAYEFYVPQKKVHFSKRSYFFFFLERVAIKNASIVFAANVERARLMKSVYRRKTRPVAVLNIPSRHHDISNKQYPTSINNDNNIIVVYEGFIDMERNLDLLINSFEYLPKTYKLWIIGSGNDVNKMKDLIMSKNYSDRINYKGRISSSQIIPELSQCHIGFVGYPMTDLNNIYCSPNKIYEYPAAGIPFLTTQQRPIISITSKYHICEYYNPKIDSPKDLANKIIHISCNYYHYSQNISLFNKEHSWEIEKNKITNAIISAFHKKIIPKVVNT